MLVENFVSLLQIDWIIFCLGEYLAQPGFDHPQYGYNVHFGFNDGFHGDFHDHVDQGYGLHGYGDVHAFPGFAKSKIQKTEENHADAKKSKQAVEDTKKTGQDKVKHDKPEHDKSERDKSKHEDKKHGEKHHEKTQHEKQSHEHAKRDTQSTNTKRVQLPHAQKEKTETGTKKNAIVVRRPPIIYHPPPEVYHRPDIVVHRAPIVIQRPPLVYHQSPVIVHRPAVVYHQPAVVFHQPAPAVHQPVFHSVDTFSVHPHLTFTQAGSNIHQVGQFVGVPQEVMHRSTVPSSSPHSLNDDHPRSSVPTDPHPKQRRATLEQHITPITPLNFMHPRLPRFEAPRSTIPYPSLHPHSLSYSSFPWGYSPKTKRSVEGNPYAQANLATMVPHELFPLPYSPFYHSPPLQRPHVNINIQTAKSNVPNSENRERRQSVLEPSQSQVLEPSSIQPGAEVMHSGPMMSYPGLPRPHVNVNVETIKSAVPRNRRQVLAGLPTEEAQPNMVPQTYSQAVVPVAPAQLTHPPEEQFGVYRDILGAIYPRGARRRPKVNIVVQTAKSKIPVPQNVKKSVFPPTLNKDNVDAFSTMPEVTTIEPPLLRDGVRVNMVDLGDPTSSPAPSNSAPILQPSYGNTNLQNFGTNLLGLGAQGNFGMDKWKKSAISEPTTTWRDVNAEKKSSVPGVNRKTDGKKRFTIDGFQSNFQSPAQFSPYHSGVEPQGSVHMGQPAFAGYSNQASSANPAAYTAEPQSVVPQASSATEQEQPEPANYANQVSGTPQRPQVNVNVETFKKHTVGFENVANKRQLIGALPLTSLFRPNPNTVKASLKSMVPSKNQIPANNAKPVTKRQQIMGRVPLAQALPQLRNRVSSMRGSPASSRPVYPAFPVQETRPQSRQFSYPDFHPATHPQVLTPPPSESYVSPLPEDPAPASYLHPSIYPWGGRRQHVNINIETAKSKIPSKANTLSKSNKIITPRFKREFPVLYNIIKAKVKSDTAKRETKTRRDKRQIPMFPGDGFLQSLIPDPNLLAKRAFYGAPR